MMAFFGFLLAVALFFHYKRRLHYFRDQYRLEDDEPRSTAVARWHDQWHRQWADKFERRAHERTRPFEDKVERKLRALREKAARFALVPAGNAAGTPDDEAAQRRAREEKVLRQARRRAMAEVGFYTHLMSYLGVMAFLALANLFTTSYPWFIWPALGWGIGLFAHYMAVFGSRMIRERYFDPAIEREVRREKIAAHTDKQASIDELSATIAHEIRNPIAAAKSLVQQMGEDPASVENVEYGRVALEELDRVERRISHLLKYAKEEDYRFEPIRLAEVVDASLTQMRSKLDGAGVRIARHYIGGPTVYGDPEKLRQVFSNILDNAADALLAVTEGRRIDLFVENGGRKATVRIRDNGTGIPAERIDRIFNPFYTTKEKGTGLGMAISKKIVEAHEGAIDVSSEPGHGAEFVVTLPLPR